MLSGVDVREGVKNGSDYRETGQGSPIIGSFCPIIPRGWPGGCAAAIRKPGKVSPTGLTAYAAACSMWPDDLTHRKRPCRHLTGSFVVQGLSGDSGLLNTGWSERLSSRIW